MPAAVGLINLDHPRRCAALSNSLALVSVHTGSRNVEADFAPTEYACRGTAAVLAVSISRSLVWQPGYGMGRQSDDYGAHFELSQEIMQFCVLYVHPSHNAILCTVWARKS